MRFNLLICDHEQITDSFESVNRIAKTFEEVCISLSITTYNTSQDDMVLNNSTGEYLPADIIDIIERTCPNNCNNKGNCTEGVCHCQTGTAKVRVSVYHGYCW